MYIATVIYYCRGPIAVILQFGVWKKNMYSVFFVKWHWRRLMSRAFSLCVQCTYKYTTQLQQDLCATIVVGERRWRIRIERIIFFNEMTANVCRWRAVSCMPCHSFLNAAIPITHTTISKPLNRGSRRSSRAVFSFENIYVFIDGRVLPLATVYD